MVLRDTSSLTAIGECQVVLKCGSKASELSGSIYYEFLFTKFDYFRRTLKKIPHIVFESNLQLRRLYKAQVSVRSQYLTFQ